MASAVLLARGPLRQGRTATITSFVYQHGGTIVGHDQYVDPERRRYYVRLAWETELRLDLSHCLHDILGRWRSGEWEVEIERR